MSSAILAESDELLVDRRDARLLELIKQMDDHLANPARVVGILYGAVHMRAVSRLLLGPLKYSIAESEWITVLE